MEIVTINESLRSVCDHLNRGSLNYQVDIKLFDCPGMAGSGVLEIVQSGLGTAAELGGTFSTSPQDALQEFVKALDYSGDAGSHPNPEAFSSTEDRSRRAELVRDVGDLLTSSDQIIGFWLKEGHPFYPVFWDFAYVVEQRPRAWLFVGSSSD
jgi:hypothetical protein